MHAQVWIWYNCFKFINDIEYFEKLILYFYLVPPLNNAGKRISESVITQSKSPKRSKYIY